MKPFKWIKSKLKHKDSQPESVETMKKEPEENAPLDALGAFSTDFNPISREKIFRDVNAQFKKGNLVAINPKTGKNITGNTAGYAMDSCDGSANLKQALMLNQSAISDSILGWYASQGFIGYQTMAIIAQHWLVDKACEMPAKDALRNGYRLTFNDGEQNINNKVIDKIRKLDKTYQIKKKLKQHVKLGRVFGIRVSMFKIDFDDREAERDFYARPFDINQVRPGSYKGIVQIDPYWLSPELDQAAASEPGSMHFYEPTWWRLSGGMRVHRSHLVIYVNGEVADVLKPNYLYGGVSVPQKIFERVYASERTANEGPQLALSKRTNVMKTDITKATANPAAFIEKILSWINFRDNFGVKVVDRDETIDQFETSLADLDAVIMTEYQLVSSIANVPSTKLLGTAPKGFNATGEFEIETYNQELESIQENDFDPLLDRHYMLVIKSDIEPEYGVSQEPEVVWNPLDVPTAKELAEINNIKSLTAVNYQAAGAVDGEDIRSEVIADENSGFDGMIDADMQDEDLSDLAGMLLDDIDGR